MPFVVKSKVAEAAISTSVLHSCVFCVPAETRTKFKTYLEFNLDMTVNTEIYINLSLPEHYRKAATSFRLSLLSLLVEKLCWSRIPSQEKLFPCNNIDIQNESHFYNNCAHTEELRNSLSITTELSLDSIFQQEHVNIVCEYIYKGLKLF